MVIYNDHGLNSLLDKMPTFAIGAAPEYRNDDEGWGIPTLPPFALVTHGLSWHIINSVMAEEFDKSAPAGDDGGVRRLHRPDATILG